MSAAAASRQGNTRAQGQISKCNELLNEVADVNRDYCNQVWAELKSRWATNTCTFEFVSSQISAMIEAKKAARWLRLVPDLPEVADGRYGLLEPGTENTWKFYRVTNRHGDLRLFVYASDAQHLISNKQTMLAILRRIDANAAQAQRDFRHSNCCYRCGRRLTDEVSRERGLGPDCASR